MWCPWHSHVLAKQSPKIGWRRLPAAWVKDWGNDMPSLMNVALGRNGDGYLEVLATSTVVGSEPTVWHAEEDLDGKWSSWRPFGKPGHSRLTAVSVMPHVTDGRLEAFTATERNPSVWHRWQTQSGTSDWSHWELMAEFVQGIEAGPLAIGLTDGR